MVEICADELRFLKERRLLLIFIILSVLAPTVSLIEVLRPESESFHTWFQRSGSIMVLLAIISEMKAYQMFDVFKPSGFVSNTYNTTKEKYHPQIKIWNTLAFICIFIGTIIWGYGDLLI